MNPDAPLAPQLCHLGTLAIDLDSHITIGETPFGTRSYAVIAGGQFSGSGIDALILPGGSDSLLQTIDGSAHPDVRLLLQTGDGQTILVTYRGIRHVEGERDYWRCLPTFQTASPEHYWLNRIICVACGRFQDDRILYEIFRVE
jgi:hypothetical protein